MPRGSSIAIISGVQERLIFANEVSTEHRWNDIKSWQLNDALSKYLTAKTNSKYQIVFNGSDPEFFMNHYPEIGTNFNDIEPNRLKVQEYMTQYPAADYLILLLATPTKCGMIHFTDRSMSYCKEFTGYWRKPEWSANAGLTILVYNSKDGHEIASNYARTSEVNPDFNFIDMSFEGDALKAKQQLLQEGELLFETKFKHLIDKLLIKMQF